MTEFIGERIQPEEMKEILIFGWGDKHGRYGWINLKTGAILYDSDHKILYKLKLNRIFCASIVLIEKICREYECAEKIVEWFNESCHNFGSYSLQYNIDNAFGQLNYM